MRSTASTLAVLVAAIACGSPEPPTEAGGPSDDAPLARLAPRHRLVDLLQPRRPGEPLRSATIADDTRHVLGAYRDEKIFFQQKGIVVPEDGVLALSPPAGAMLGQLDEVVIEGEVRIDGAWQDVPLSRSPVAREAASGPATVPVRLALASQAGREVGITLNAIGPLATSPTVVATPPLEIAEDAALHFAIGVLELEAGDASARFRVEVCDVEPDEPRCTTRFEERIDTATAERGRWRDRHVSLSDHAGRRVSLRFASEQIAAAGASGPSPFVFPMFANPTILEPVREPERPPNFILISIDTLRADHLDVYGYPLETAPFIAQAFGDGGTVFENAVAAAASTGPSHMSIFTGHDAIVHRVSNLWDRLSPAIPTLAEKLREGGLATGAVTENAAMTLGQRFNRGFDDYFENKTTRLRDFSGQIDLTLERSLAWLERHREQRFFLFVHTYQVHYPYSPPAAYDHLFADAPAPDDIPPDRAPALYDREIRYTDDELRRFFGQIEALGLAEYTIVVLTSDHGDEFYEHDYLDHGGSLFGSAIHVPLLFRGPGIPAGRRIAQPVGHVDVMPTLLELAGVDLPPDLDGRSLASAFAPGAPIEHAEAATLYSETRVPWARTRAANGNMARIPQPTISVRRGRHKVIRTAGRDGARLAYYDLARDPGERIDRWSERTPSIDELVQALELYGLRAKEARKRYPSDLPDVETTGGFDVDYEDKLRALGYIE